MNRMAIQRYVTRAGERRRRVQRIVGLIPARGNSKGIPRKNLRHVAGYPMVGLSVLTLRAAGVRPVYVSTEDAEIAEVSKVYGAQIIERPKEFASNESSTELVIEHFLTQVECDLVVMVQCTSPLLRPRDIVRGLDQMLAFSLDAVFSAVPASDMLIWDKELRPWNYNPKRRGRRQNRGLCAYIESGAFYIFKKSMFEREKCRIGGRYDVCPVPFWQSFQVDDKKDLAMVRKLMDKP